MARPYSWHPSLAGPLVVCKPRYGAGSQEAFLAKGVEWWDKVLPPGLYPTNPREQQVDIVGVGLWETTIHIDTDKPGTRIRTDESGEPVYTDIRGGISFPSSDGFNIVMDFTAVWGLMPEQAPNAIRKFGNIDLVENKVIIPQIESMAVITAADLLYPIDEVPDWPRNAVGDDDCERKSDKENEYRDEYHCAHQGA